MFSENQEFEEEQKDENNGMSKFKESPIPPTQQYVGESQLLDQSPSYFKEQSHMQSLMSTAIVNVNGQSASKPLSPNDTQLLAEEQQQRNYQSEHNREFDEIISRQADQQYNRDTTTGKSLSSTTDIKSLNERNA